MGIDISRRPGHPLDEALYDSTVLSWFAPALALMFRRILVIAPFAVAMALYVWLLPRLSLAGPFDPAWLIHLDALLHTAVLTAIMVSGFAVLARVEGGPWGHGALLPWPAAALRVAILVAIWYALSWLLGVLFTDLIFGDWLMHLMLRLFNALGFWGIYLLIAVLSPLPLMLGTVQFLSFIHALRSDEPLGTVLMTSFALVFGQSRRFVLPFMLITFGLCVLVHLFIKLEPRQLLIWLFNNITGVTAVLTAIGTAFSLAWWFVAERALRPDLGLEADAAFDVDDDPGMVAGGDSASSSAGGAPAAAASTSSNDPVDLARQLVELEAEAGPVMAARRLVAWLRGRRLAPADYPTVRDALTDSSELAPQLVGLALEWRDFSRPGELAFVIGEGLRLDRGFLMNLPGEVLATAKRLGVQDQHDLAARLLLPFLDRHKTHDDHAEAGVQMARILAFHRDKPEAGLRLLRQLATVHPEHPAITAMIRQLEH